MSVMFNSGSKNAEKRRHVDSIESSTLSLDDVHHHRHDQEVIGSLCRLGDSGSPQETVEYCVDEKRVRREIANSNERRRMQSINAGFQSLRSLLPQSEGEKLSKAAILQQTTEYIYQLEQEKSRLVAQNCHLKRLIGPLKKDLLDSSVSLSPEPINEVTVGSTDILLSGANKKNAETFSQADSKEKRKGMLTGEAYSRAVDRLRKEVNESRALLEAERKLRLKLEEQIHALEAQLQLQIDVPDVDASEITAHILGRKPHPPLKTEKIQEEGDEDSDLIAAARNASTAHSKWSNNNNIRKSSAPVTTNQRRNVITSAGNLSRQESRESQATASPVHQSDTNDHPTNRHTQQQVQLITSQGALMTSLPAHLVLDDRPSSQAGSLLEAAMMAEPKVEVELASRVPSPALSLAMTGGPSSPSSTSLPLSSLPVLSFQLPPHLAHLSHLASADGSSSPITVLQHTGDVDGVTFVDIDGQLNAADSKSYLAAATSRQNLETIVEAIRHLEGDHLFNDDASCSRNGAQLVQVEIDTDTIGCSLVVTSAQDESGDDNLTEAPNNLQLTISEDQEVGEMITVTSDEAVEEIVTAEGASTSNDNGESTSSEVAIHQETNVIVVKQM